MIGLSRRQLANYALDQLIAGEPVSSVSRKLAAALAAAKKSKDVDLLMNDISQELENRGLQANAKIISARPLSAELITSLRDQIKQSAKVQAVVVDTEIDSSVIGGFKIETASRSIDKTIARRLSDIKGGN